MDQRAFVFSKLKFRWKTKGADHCPICGEVIIGKGVERFGKRFCQSWHADFYRTPPPRWRLHWPDDEAGAGGGGCCG